MSMDAYPADPPRNLPPQVQEALETLIRVVLPFARNMIARYGGFYPFGATLRADGEVAAVAGYDDERRLSHQEALDVLRAGLHRQVAGQEVMATAVCSDVLVTPPGSGEAADAIQLDLEHRSGQALRVWLPYTRAQDGEAVFGRPVLEVGTPEFFSSTQNQGQST